MVNASIKIFAALLVAISVATAGAQDLPTSNAAVQAEIGALPDSTSVRAAEPIALPDSLPPSIPPPMAGRDSSRRADATVTIRAHGGHKRREVSVNTLRRDEIAKVVATSHDPIRALPTLPGVSTASDLSVRPVVRGGDEAETKVELDGVPLIMPYHFGSVFSVFHQEALQDFKLYSGVAPASAEGALSGTLLARTRSAPLDTTFGGLDFSLLRGSAWVGIPLVRDRVGLWVSGQSMWYDWTIKRSLDLTALFGGLAKSDVEEYKATTSLPTNWDVQGGISSRLSRDWTLDVGGFVAKDTYRLLESRTACLDGGQEIGCVDRLHAEIDGPSTENDICWYEGREIPCPRKPGEKKVYDTVSNVELSNWMSMTRLSWSPDPDLVVEGVVAYQSVDWDVQFPPERTFDYNVANKRWTSRNIEDSSRFDWRRNALDLRLSTRKRWTDDHETQAGIGWDRGTEIARTDVDRPLAMLIQGTTGNPLEFAGVYNESEILVLSKGSPFWYGIGRLESLDFQYDFQETRQEANVWAEHRWDLSSETRLRAGVRLAADETGGFGIPNPRVQIQTQVTESDLIGLGLALHTQSDLPFDWRAAASQTLVPEKALLAITEWEHAYAPGWRSTLSLWGKYYQDLASPWVERYAPPDPEELREAMNTLYFQHESELNVPDSVLRWNGPVWDPAQDPAEFDRLYREYLRAYDSARFSYLPRRYIDSVIPWLQPKRLRYTPSGIGWAVGVEASLRYQPTPGWTGWASAEWSMSRRRDREGGPWYPFGQERPWKLSWVNAFRIDRTWDLNFRYAAMAGNPYTPFQVRDDSPDPDVNAIDTVLWIGTRNSRRFAPYQRLDVRVAKNTTVFGKPATFYYEIWNAFNDPNSLLRDSESGRYVWASLNLPLPVVFLGVEVRL